MITLADAHKPRGGATLRPRIEFFEVTSSGATERPIEDFSTRLIQQPNQLIVIQ